MFRYTQTLECRVLVSGGGLYGCGFAAVIPGAVLIEENNIPGSDFTLSLAQYGHESFDTALHPLADKFQKSLLKRNAYTESGLLRPAALTPELDAWLLQAGVNIRLASALHIAEDGSPVLAGVDGLCRVSCEKIYDFRNLYAGEQKSCHALIDFCGSDVIKGDFSFFSLTASAVPGCAILSLTLADSDGWTEARQKLRNAWNMRPPSLFSGRIAWTSAAFSYTRHPGPVHALDAGLHHGETVK